MILSLSAYSNFFSFSKIVMYDEACQSVLSILNFPFPFSRTRSRTLFYTSQNSGREIASRKLCPEKSVRKLVPENQFSEISGKPRAVWLFKLQLSSQLKFEVDRHFVDSQSAFPSLSLSLSFFLSLFLSLSLSFSISLFLSLSLSFFLSLLIKTGDTSYEFFSSRTSHSK